MKAGSTNIYHDWGIKAVIHNTGAYDGAFSKAEGRGFDETHSEY